MAAAVPVTLAPADCDVGTVHVFISRIPGSFSSAAPRDSFPPVVGLSGRGEAQLGDDGGQTVVQEGLHAHEVAAKYREVNLNYGPDACLGLPGGEILGVGEGVYVRHADDRSQHDARR